MPTYIRRNVVKAYQFKKDSYTPSPFIEVVVGMTVFTGCSYKR
jgi:hypothetical protein